MSRNNNDLTLRHVLYDPDIVEFNLAIQAGEGEELSRQEILDALADRERYEFEQGVGKAIPDIASEGLEEEGTDRDPASLIELMSAESYDAIVTWETGGKRYRPTP